MADFDKISINGTFYDVKDTTARTGLSSVETKVDDLETGLSSVETKADDLETGLSSVETKVDNLENRPVSSVYNSMERAKQDSRVFQTGDCISIAGKLGPAVWKCVASGSEGLFIFRNAGGSAFQIVPGDVVAVTDLNSDLADIGAVVNSLISNNYTHIYIPRGTYTISTPITLTEGVIIEGDNAGANGLPVTQIRPSANVSVFYLNGSYIRIKNLHLIDKAGSTKAGIQCNGGNNFQNSLVENVVIENFKYGMVLFGSCIWNTFIKLSCYGCFSRGLFVTGTAAQGTFFNNCTFIQCKFNNNGNAGVYIDVTKGNAIGVNFVGCNIELNLGGMSVTPDDTMAFYSNCQATLESCYFEGNTKNGNQFVITNTLNMVLLGCVFITEKGYPVRVDYGQNTHTYSVGAWLYNCTKTGVYNTTLATAISVGDITG